MPADSKSYLAGLEDKLEKLPFPLTISDISQPDHPLIFMNSAFRHVTGYGPEMLGTNCRFLQSGLPNEDARAEIRECLAVAGKVQVVLKNRRKNGQEFDNLLMLETLAGQDGAPGLAIGSQFDIGQELGEPATKIMSDRFPTLISDLGSQAQRLRIERRRLMSDAAVRLVQSWTVLNDGLKQG